MKQHIFSLWQPAHKPLLPCLFFVWLCIPIFILEGSLKRGGEENKKIKLLPFCLQPEILIMCSLARGRLNKFKVKQTAAFSHTAARGETTFSEIELGLFRIQMNVEVTLLHKWRKHPTDTNNQRCRYQLVVKLWACNFDSNLLFTLQHCNRTLMHQTSNYLQVVPNKITKIALPCFRMLFSHFVRTFNWLIVSFNKNFDPNWLLTARDNTRRAKTFWSPFFDSGKYSNI